MKLFIKVCGKGNLLEEKNDLLAMRMFFVLFKCNNFFMFFGFIPFKFLYKVNLSSFNGIRITVKTDGNTYKILMRIDSDLDYDHNVYVNEKKDCFLKSSGFYCRSIKRVANDGCFYFI